MMKLKYTSTEAMTRNTESPKLSLSLNPGPGVIVLVKAVMKTIRAGLRIIPTVAPNNIGNRNCIQIERLSCLTALKISCRNRDQTESSVILSLRNFNHFSTWNAKTSKGVFLVALLRSFYLALGGGGIYSSLATDWPIQLSEAPAVCKYDEFRS